jgi:hypothetical protein
MRRSPPLLALLFLLTLSFSAAASTPDVEARLRAIPGLTVVAELPSRFPGVRAFHLELEQPADHARPEGQRFRQRAVLQHRSFEAPMVLALSGYGIGLSAFEFEPTRLLVSNQLHVEHRFFGPSTPQPPHWEHLTIEQAAGDHHRFVQALKPLYSGRWVNTGQSKGGMAAVYHRYFHPDDVDATVAYWAPTIHGVADVRYTHWLENEGGTAECRARIFALQREVLLRRERMMPLMDGLAAQTGATYNILGKERAFEFAAVELPFYLFQEWNRLCPFISGPEDSDEDVFFWFAAISSLDYYFADDFLSRNMPFYYQAATELGLARYPEKNVRDLLRYPREDRPAAFVTFPIEKPYNPAPLLRVEHWVRNAGPRIMFVYGAEDPWSAGAFQVSEANDSFRYFVPRDGHITSISRLPEPQRGEARAKVRAWGGVAQPAALTLEAEEASLRGEEHLLRP